MPATDAESSSITRSLNMIPPEHVVDADRSQDPDPGIADSRALRPPGRRKNFYVCSYGGSGSWMLVKFLRRFGNAFHVHSRCPPSRTTTVEDEQFTGTPGNPDEDHYRIFLYSRPEYAITRRWNWTTDHWRNIGIDRETFSELPASPKDYTDRPADDLIRYEEFFDNYLDGSPHCETICVNLHEIWDNLKEFFEALDFGGRHVEQMIREFPSKQKRQPPPVSRPRLFESLNRKIDGLPGVSIVPARPSRILRRAETIRGMGIFLGGTIDAFEKDGRDQYIRLLQDGLSPESTLLDVGCGCLRGGCWTIPFLDRGNYCGIEPNTEMLEAGKRYLMSPETMTRKQPVFDSNDQFDVSVFGRKFDFFMLGSIWTHAPRWAVRTTIEEFRTYANPGAILLASFIRTDGPTTAGGCWIGKSHESDEPGLVAWNWDDLNEIVNQHEPVSLQHLQPKARNTISWLRLRFDG